MNNLKMMPNALNNIKKNNPLIHCITNYVTVNDCANAILGIGASPLMAEDINEINEISTISKSLVINIGTLNKNQINSIKYACEKANLNKIPITIDPVGVGISNLRKNTIKELIDNYKITTIRGNMSEIKTIANLNKKNYSLEANISDITTKENLNENAKIVKKLAQKLNSIIIASGPIDIISSNKTTIAIENGDKIMEKITGSGCILTSIIGSCISVNEPLEGSVLGSLILTIAGEKAKKEINKFNLGTGNFRNYLIDNIYKFKEDDFKQAKIMIL